MDRVLGIDGVELIGINNRDLGNMHNSKPPIYSFLDRLHVANCYKETNLNNKGVCDPLGFGWCKGEGDVR